MTAAYDLDRSLTLCADCGLLVFAGCTCTCSRRSRARRRRRERIRERAMRRVLGDDRRPEGCE